MKPLLLCLPLLFSALEECADCVPGTRKAALCELHAGAEKDGIKACSTALRRGDAAERLAALRALAALTEAHTNAPSPALVKALAPGLEDEAEGVTLGTIELLGKQHPEAVLALYGDQAKKLAKRYEKLEKSAAKIRDRRESRSREDPKDEAELLELQAEMAAIGLATDGISAQLGQLRDDRAVTALETLLEGNGREATVSALATLGNVEAAQVLHHYMQEHAELFQLLSGLQSTLAEAAELTGQEPDENVQSIYDAARKPVAAAHAALTRIAEGADLLQGMPTSLPEEGDPWGDWLKQNRKALPPAFGRMPMPWDG